MYVFMFVCACVYLEFNKKPIINLTPGRSLNSNLVELRKSMTYRKKEKSLSVTVCSLVHTINTTMTTTDIKSKAKYNLWI